MPFQNFQQLVQMTLSFSISSSNTGAPAPSRNGSSMGKWALPLSEYPKPTSASSWHQCISDTECQWTPLCWKLVSTHYKTGCPLSIWWLVNIHRTTNHSITKTTKSHQMEKQYVPMQSATASPSCCTTVIICHRGCPVKTGRPWTTDKMTAAVMCDPHSTAMAPDTMVQLNAEVNIKVKQGQARVVL